MLKKYLSREFNLICLTDQQPSSDRPITFVDITEYELDTWWNKVLIFKFANYGLYFDLDIEIRHKLYFIFDDIEAENITIVDTPWKNDEYFAQKSTRVSLSAFLSYGNSSVIGWSGDHSYLTDMLLEDVFKHTVEHFGDDTFISAYGKKIKYFKQKIDTYDRSGLIENAAILTHYQPIFS